MNTLLPCEYYEEQLSKCIFKQIEINQNYIDKNNIFYNQCFMET